MRLADRQQAHNHKNTRTVEHLPDSGAGLVDGHHHGVAARPLVAEALEGVHDVLRLERVEAAGGLCVLFVFV